MNIINIIENCIELSIRRDRINNTIENSKRYYYYAKVEGDMAFNRKDYEMEKAYNNSARGYIETQDKAEKELTQISQLLDTAYENYNNEIQILNENQLSNAIMILTLKKEEIERKIQELTEHRQLASSKGDIVFANANYEEEKKYNEISLKCYLEIEKLKILFKYYNKFINDLNYYMNNRYGSNGHSK